MDVTSYPECHVLAALIEKMKFCLRAVWNMALKQNSHLD